MKKTISLRINGSERSVEVEARTTLLDLVREQFGLTGAKLGCDIQVCGACTLLVDGKVKIAGPNGQRTITVEELFLDFYTTSLAEDEILTVSCVAAAACAFGIEYIRFSSSSVVDKPWRRRGGAADSRNSVVPRLRLGASCSAALARRRRARAKPKL